MKSCFLSIFCLLMCHMSAWGQDESVLDQTASASVKDTTVIVTVQQDFGQYALDPAGKYFVVLPPPDRPQKKANSPKERDFEGEYSSQEEYSNEEEYGAEEEVHYREKSSALKGLMDKNHRILLEPIYSDIRMLGNCVMALSVDHKTTFVFDPSFKLIYKGAGLQRFYSENNPLKSELSEQTLRIMDSTYAYTYIIFEKDGKHIRTFDYVSTLEVAGNPLYLVSNQLKVYANYDTVRFAFYRLEENKVKTGFVYSEVTTVGQHLIKAFHSTKNKWQLLDTQLKVLYEGATLAIQPYFHQGMEAGYVVSKEKEQPFIVDKRGKKINKQAYSQISTIYMDKSSYLIAVQNNKYGLVDGKENILLPFDYDSIWYASYRVRALNEDPNSWGYPMVFLKKKSKYGVFEPSGILREAKYERIYRSEDQYGLATDDFVFRLNGKYGLVKEGATALEAEYDTIFRNPMYVKGKEVQYYIFKKQGQYGYLTWDGQYIAPRYNEILGDKRALVFKKKETYQVLHVGQQEEMELKKIKQLQKLPNSDVFTYKEKKKYGLFVINEDLYQSVKYPQLFDSIIHPSFSYDGDGEFLVSLQGKWGIWRLRDQSFIVPILYDAPPTARFSNGFLVSNNHLYGVFDQYTAMEVVPCKYTSIEQVDYSGEYHVGVNTYKCQADNGFLYVLFPSSQDEEDVSSKHSSIVSQNNDYKVESQQVSKDSVYYYVTSLQRKQRDSEIYETSVDISGVCSDRRSDNISYRRHGIQNEKGKEIVPLEYSNILYRQNYYLASNWSGSTYHDRMYTFCLFDKKGTLVRKYERIPGKQFVECIFRNNPENLLNYTTDVLQSYSIEEDNEYAPLSTVLKSLRVIGEQKTTYFIYHTKKDKLLSPGPNPYYTVLSDDFFYSQREQDEPKIVYNAEGEKLLEGKELSFTVIGNKELLVIDEKKRAIILHSQGTITSLSDKDLYLAFLNKNHDLLVKKNNKYGIVNREMKVLLPAEYDTLYYKPFQEEANVNPDYSYQPDPVRYYLAKKKKKWGLLVNERIVLEAEYDSIASLEYLNQPEWFLVIKNGKQNVFNTKEEKFEIDHFADKVARVSYSTIEPGCLDDISYDYTKILVRDGKKVYINHQLTDYQDFYAGRNVEIAGEPNYDQDQRPDYTDNKVVLFLKKNNKWGAVDLNNIVIVPLAYDTIEYISHVVSEKSLPSESDSFADALGFPYAIVRNANKRGLYYCTKFELMPCVLPKEREGNYPEYYDSSYRFSNVNIAIQHKNYFKKTQ